jgi:hypothetical protein
LATKFLLLIAILLTGRLCFCQASIDSILGKIDVLKWSTAIEKKAEELQEKIINKSEKTLDRLQRREERIYKKMLNTKDSLIAKAALLDLSSKYKSLKGKIRSSAMGNGAKQYIPKLDTLNTALKFLDQNGVSGKVKDALDKTESLRDKFQQAEEIKKFIAERKQQLKAQLENLGTVKQLKNFNKEVYYYSEQIKEYKEILHDSKKAERKVLELLSKTKLFNNFMRQNSLFASLFRLPGTDGDPVTQANLAGLQTRVQVNNLIQQQIAGGGAAASNQFRQNLQSAQSQMNQLKSKVTQLGGNGSDDIMPDGFKPNSQKTRGFLKRLEIGTNTQTQKATNLFPVTSDLGLSIGYKLNDKSVIGIGASYKLGWGRGWGHIKLTNEGAGLRSFIDWKIKGSLWMTGGYEQNYKTAFSNVDQLRNLSSWLQSGLLGLSKVVSVKSKFFKKTKLQLLWDFLSYQQVPRTHPVVFRVGYSF